MDSVETLLQDLEVKEESYQKGETVFESEMMIEDLAILLSGEVHIIKRDYLGNQNIISVITPGGMFGESYACSDREKSGVDAVAAAKSELLLIKASKILEDDSVMGSNRGILIRNLMHIMANKNISLSRKLDHLTKRSIREKLMSYLTEVSGEMSTSSFTIPFNRQQLSDYLCVDRAALSREMMKLKQEGVIEYERDQFSIL